MTTFKRIEELKELCKDYQHNKNKILEIFDDYFLENAEELGRVSVEEFMKDIVSIKDFKI